MHLTNFLSDLCNRPYTCQQTCEVRSLRRPRRTCSYASSFRPRKFNVSPFIAKVSN